MIDPVVISKLLEKNNFISKIYFLDELDSTNDYAKKNKLPSDSLIITNYQKKGRGRFDRAWETEKNKNITFTITKTLNIKPHRQINFVYYASYSVFSALKRLTEEYGKATDILEIKWPNDILLNNKKVAGILIETDLNNNIYIIGIGINVNHRSFSPETSAAASSLQNELDREFNLNDLFADVFEALCKNYSYLSGSKFSNIYNLWKSRLKCIGKNVIYSDRFGQKKQGKIIDIVQSGTIIIEENGSVSNYNSEEIKLLNNT